MIVLAFDTCLDACSAALLDTGAERSFARFEPMQTGHAERLMPMIEAVMAEAGASFGSIDRLAVTVGPGTFTGTRISVAAARAMSLALGRPCIAESSLAVMAEAIATGTAATSQPLVIASDARRGEVYVQAFVGREAIGPPQVAAYETVAESLRPDTCTWLAGSGALAVIEAARPLGRPVEMIRADLLPEAVFLARRAARANAPTGAAGLEPVYLRPADAKPQTGKSLPRATP